MIKPTSLFSHPIFLFLPLDWLAIDYRQIKFKKKVRLQSLLETKKICPEQKKYAANLTSFRTEKNLVFSSAFFFCFNERWRLSVVSGKPDNIFISFLDWINLLIFICSVSGWELRTWTLKPKVWTSQIWALIHLINNFVIALFAWNLRS